MRAETEKSELHQIVDTLKKWTDNIVTVTSGLREYGRRQLNVFIRDVVEFGGPTEALEVKAALRRGLRANDSLSQPDRTFAQRIVNLARPGKRDIFKEHIVY